MYVPLWNLMYVLGENVFHMQVEYAISEGDSCNNLSLMRWFLELNSDLVLSFHKQEPIIQ
jgi:hypothetical protein